MRERRGFHAANLMNIKLVFSLLFGRNKKKTTILPVILLISIFILSACGQSAPSVTETPVSIFTFTSVPPTATEMPVPATKTPVPATSKATIVPVPILDIGSTEISPKDDMILLYVPQGKFLMGSTYADALASADEKPQHSVTLKAFWIDQTEVTNAMYAKCVADSACIKPIYKGSNTRPSYYGNSEFDHYPVLFVDWDMANSYCSWAGRELPTEAQWEKAASWNDLKQEKYIYPWGNDFNGSIVNFCDKNCTFDGADKNSDDGFVDTSPVKNYPDGISPYGAYDMAGNVFEWVNDWYQSDYYATLGDNASNPQGPASGDSRVLRGGSWYDFDFIVGSALRSRDNPTVANDFIGFRCARSLP
jgi:formylglycine-generating enzyme required for sulfatase activity